MELYGKRVFGVEVSDYGLKNGYLDFLTLSKIVGPCIMNNYLRAETMEDWEIVAGDLGRKTLSSWLKSFNTLDHKEDETE